MPVRVGAKGSQPGKCPASKPWPIVEVATGTVKGCSTSKALADSSARARNAAHFNPAWKPTGKPRRR